MSLEREGKGTGRVWRREREKAKQTFWRSCEKRLPAWDCGTSSRPHPSRSQPQIPRGVFQHLQARTATPASSPGNFRVLGVYTWQAKAGADQEFTLRRQRQKLTRTKSIPSPSSLAQPLGFLFPHCKAGAGQNPRKPPRLKPTWKQEREKPPNAPRKVPKAGVFSFRE